MKKRTIKKRFKRFDELALPQKEKILPEEALTEAACDYAKRRNILPRLAIGAISIAVLAVLVAVVIGYVPKDTNTDNPAVLDNEALKEESTPSDISAEESEAPKANMSIAFFGKYDPKTSGTSFGEVSVEDGTDSDWFVPIGEVGIGTMLDTEEEIDDIDDLQDGVLYPVRFIAQPYGSTEFKEGIKRLAEEKLEKQAEREKTLIAFIEEHAQDRSHFFFEYYAGYDYHEICELIYKQNFPEHWPGQDAPEFDNIVELFETNVFDKYYEKQIEYINSAKEAVEAKMYQYLEGIGIKFYDKTVYFCYDETKKGFHEDVFRIAFVTKEQLVALKGGEDYGIYVSIAFEELATMDDEPVYLILKPQIAVD